MADSGRPSQFSFAENICILEEYKAAKSILKNKFSHYYTNNKKHKAWTTITEKEYCVDPSVARTAKGVQRHGARGKEGDIQAKKSSS